MSRSRDLMEWITYCTLVGSVSFAFLGKDIVTRESPEKLESRIGFCGSVYSDSLLTPLEGEVISTESSSKQTSNGLASFYKRRISIGDTLVTCVNLILQNEREDYQFFDFGFSHELGDNKCDIVRHNYWHILSEDDFDEIPVEGMLPLRIAISCQQHDYYKINLFCSLRECASFSVYRDIPFLGRKEVQKSRLKISDNFNSTYRMVLAEFEDGDN